MVQVQYAAKFKFPVSNNVTEYEALIAGLRFATKSEVDHLEDFSDSKLIANQVAGNFKVRDPTLIKYQELVVKLRA